MKLLFLISCFVFSLTTLKAQVKTGGGLSDDDFQDQQLAQNMANERLTYHFMDLTRALKDVEKKCSQRKSFPSNYNFIDSYYTLSLKKAGAHSSEGLTEKDCRPSEAVAKCLSTPDIKHALKKISDEQAYLGKFLEKEYKLDEKSGAIMLKFFGAP